MSAVVQHPRLAEIIARRKLRQRIECAVGRLIEALDALDPDPQGRAVARHRLAACTYGKSLAVGAALLTLIRDFDA